MNEDEALADVAWESAKMFNGNSQSNGSMMRCTPMVVFTASVSNVDDIKQAIISDIKMTHPNKLVQEAIWIYSIAIQYLLNNPTVHNRAQSAYDIALQMSQDGIEMNDLKGKKQSVKKWLILAASIDELTSEDELLIKPIPEDMLNCRELIGWL